MPGGAVSLEGLFDSLAESDHAGRLIVAHYLADAQAALADEVLGDAWVSSRRSS